MTSSVGQSMINSCWNIGVQAVHKAAENPVGTLNILAGLAAAGGTVATVYQFGGNAIPKIGEAVFDTLIHGITACVILNPSVKAEIPIIGMNFARIVQILDGTCFGAAVASVDLVVHAINTVAASLSHFDEVVGNTDRDVHIV